MEDLFLDDIIFVTYRLMDSIYHIKINIVKKFSFCDFFSSFYHRKFGTQILTRI